MKKKILISCIGAILSLTSCGGIGSVVSSSTPNSQDSIQSESSQVSSSQNIDSIIISNDGSSTGSDSLEPSLTNEKPTQYSLKIDEKILDLLMKNKFNYYEAQDEVSNIHSLLFNLGLSENNAILFLENLEGVTNNNGYVVPLKYFRNLCSIISLIEEEDFKNNFTDLADFIYYLPSSRRRDSNNRFNSINSAKLKELAIKDNNEEALSVLNLIEEEQAIDYDLETKEQFRKLYSYEALDKKLKENNLELREFLNSLRDLFALIDCDYFRALQNFNYSQTVEPSPDYFNYYIQEVRESNWLYRRYKLYKEQLHNYDEFVEALFKNGETINKVSKVINSNFGLSGMIMDPSVHRFIKLLITDCSESTIEAYMRLYSLSVNRGYIPSLDLYEPSYKEIVNFIFNSFKKLTIEDQQNLVDYFKDVRKIDLLTWFNEELEKFESGKMIPFSNVINLVNVIEGRNSNKSAGTSDYFHCYYMESGNMVYKNEELDINKVYISFYKQGYNSFSGYLSEMVERGFVKDYSIKASDTSKLGFIDVIIQINVDGEKFEDIICLQVVNKVDLVSQNFNRRILDRFFIVGEESNLIDTSVKGEKLIFEKVNEDQYALDYAIVVDLNELQVNPLYNKAFRFSGLDYSYQPTTHYIPEKNMLYEIRSTEYKYSYFVEHSGVYFTQEDEKGLYYQVEENGLKFYLDAVDGNYDDIYLIYLVKTNFDEETNKYSFDVEIRGSSKYQSDRKIIKKITGITDYELNDNLFKFNIDGETFYDYLVPMRSA